MPQATYRVEMEDGRVFDVEVDGDQPPTEAEILAHLDASEPTPQQAPVAPMPSHGPAPEPSIFQRLMRGAGEAQMAEAEMGRATAAEAPDLAIGAAKGAANTAIGAGELAHDYLPGVSAVNEAIYGELPPNVFQSAREQFATPANPTQQIGFAGEQAAEYLVPAAAGERLAAKAHSLLARTATRSGVGAGTNAGVAAAQGTDPTTAALFGGAVPAAASAAHGVVRTVGATAPRLVRSAIKPTVTAMKQTAGASRSGINAQADRLVRFILDNEITTPQQAQALIEDAEREIQRLAGGFRGATDAPQRAQRYLQALERSAAKQGLPSDDVAIIRHKAKELLDASPLSEDVATMRLRDSPSGLVDPSGRPAQVEVAETTRALRTDVAPDEALEIARGSSRWSTRKKWGEQKGAATEADKAVERASRDAVKTAVPETKPLLARQGQAIETRNVLDRMAFREANREPVSPFDVMTGAVEMSHGNAPVLSMGRAWLRDNKLKAGIWAKRLEKALDRRDAGEVSSILARFGVGADQQRRRPAFAPSH